jgi:hypothetical protein
MDSSAFDLLVVPVLWGTLGSIGAGAALLVVMQTIEALLKKWVSAPGTREQGTRSGHDPQFHRPAARGSAIGVHG